MGWLTVVAYAVTALLCYIAALRHPIADDTGEAHRSRSLWISIAVLMSFLCLNKQLDFQSLFTDVGRVLANKEGWYDQRRTVQLWFVLAVATAGILTLTIMVWKFRTILRERTMLLIGLTSLVTFIVIRAASFHHIHAFVASGILGIRINWILELTGIGLVALSAARSARYPRAD